MIRSTATSRNSAADIWQQTNATIGDPATPRATKQPRTKSKLVTDETIAKTFRSPIRAHNYNLVKQSGVCHQAWSNRKQGRFSVCGTHRYHCAALVENTVDWQKERADKACSQAAMADRYQALWSVVGKPKP